MCQRDIEFHPLCKLVEVVPTACSLRSNAAALTQPPSDSPSVYQDRSSSSVATQFCQPRPFLGHRKPRQSRRLRLWLRGETNQYPALQKAPETQQPMGYLLAEKNKTKHGSTSTVPISIRRLLGLFLRPYPAPTILRNESAFRLAPPTSAPSISGSLRSSEAFSGFTLPPY